MSEEVKLIKNGIRLDGRKLNEMREMEAKVGIIKRATGSAYFRLGNTSAVAAVYGPRELHPKHLVDPIKAFVKCRYNMAPFSTTERVRPGPSRRSAEISKVIREALSSVINLDEFPRAGIEIYIEILEANASTRCVGLNAASLALADAGIPMKDLMASCSVGKVDGEIVLDVAGKEDTEGEVDLPIAYIPSDNKIYLLQMDGILTHDEFKKAIGMAIEGCKKIYDEQVKALKRKYEVWEKIEEIPRENNEER
ncbi:MAG: exosome complex exonuclease Rrp41 [Candidatus Aenigmarchaeota archaeon]|nr:exosome complex exonuclease Rrp41 [Candidatus Aenigmarchaeota archaeon]